MMQREAGNLCNPAGRVLMRLPALSLRPGTCWSLLGPNGSGKSSLLREMAGRDDDQACSPWRWQDQSLPHWHDAAWARVRASLGQRQWLTASLSARTVVEMGAFPFGGVRHPRVRDTVEAVVSTWALAPLLQRPWPELSGGEQQRVQLARSQLQLRLALTEGPALWLLDEPLAALDWPHQRQVVQVCRDMAAAGALVVVSVHDVNVARELGDHSLVLGGEGVLYAGEVQDESWRLALEQAFAVSLGWVPSPSDGRSWLLPLR